MNIRQRITKLERMALDNPGGCISPFVLTPAQWEQAQINGGFDQNGKPLSGGILVIDDVMSPEAWEKAAREQQAELTQTHH